MSIRLLSIQFKAGVLAASLATGIVGCSNENDQARTDSPDFSMPVPGLPAPITPLPGRAVEEQEPAKVSLGKRLFHDPRLSGDDSMACSSCHDLSNGGDDGRRVPTGAAGKPGTVNTPTVLNSGFNFAQFWDGRARTLEQQIDSTVRNPAEMAGDWAEIERKLEADAPTAARFEKVYEDGITADNIINALAAYVRALVTPNAPFDRYLNGDANAIGDAERKGYELFTRFGCISCHQGRNIGGNLFQRFGVMGDYFADRGAIAEADYGRYNVTERESDRYLFKVPSLRNVAETAPYFHDGSTATLEEAVEIMVEYQLGRAADANEIALLVSFLRSLSGELDEGLL